MWQRFTERARGVILLAQEEAGKAGASHVGTEHLLLGLTRSEGAGAHILQSLGVSGEVVRAAIGMADPADPGINEPKLTPKAKRVLELSADEARRLRHNYIGTEHLLLGLLRIDDENSSHILRGLGLELEQTRQEVRRFLHIDGPTSDLIAVPKEKSEELRRYGEMATAQVLAHWLRDENSTVTQTLVECGLDRDAALAALESLKWFGQQENS
jgi:ATP-dependent Clp protease ATP-binding subunit ClpA